MSRNRKLRNPLWPHTNACKADPRSCNGFFVTNYAIGKTRKRAALSHANPKQRLIIHAISHARQA